MKKKSVGRKSYKLIKLLKKKRVTRTTEKCKLLSEKIKKKEN